MLTGKFRKRLTHFNLQNKISEIEEYLSFKAKSSKIELIVEANFENKREFASFIQYEQLIKSIAVNETLLDVHPLFRYITSGNLHQKLPEFVYGDFDRLQQVAVNIIENSILNSYEGSKVIVYVNYDHKNK